MVPALVNQPLYLRDEFEPHNSGDEDEGATVGRGKRKRYQNVRMLPIDELVEARTHSLVEMQDLRRKVMSIRRKNKTETMSIDQELELIKNTTNPTPDKEEKSLPMGRGKSKTKRV